MANLPFDQRERLKAQLEELLSLKEILLDEEGRAVVRPPPIEREQLEYILLIPESLILSVGERARVRALAVYRGGLRRDVSSSLTWTVSSPAIIRCVAGTVTALAQGEAMVFAHYTSEVEGSSSVTVEKTKLLAIGLSHPPRFTIRKGERFSLAASGFYTDGTKKDLTKDVIWHIGDQGILSTDMPGQFQAERVGRTTVYASYRSVRSPTVTATIFFPPRTVFLGSTLIFFMLSATAVLSLYIMVRIKAAQLKKQIALNPSRFMAELYTHSRRVLSTYGLDYRETVPSFAYARCVGEKFPSLKSLFLALTQGFSKAAYSSQVPTNKEISAFLAHYNACMVNIRGKSFRSLLHYLTFLLRRLPLTI